MSATAPVTSSDDVNFHTDDIDDALLIAASQSIENEYGIFAPMATTAPVTSSDDVNFHTDDIDDALLIAASQSIKNEYGIFAPMATVPVTSSDGTISLERYEVEVSDISDGDCEITEGTSLLSRFCLPVSSEAISRLIHDNVPRSTQKKIKWVENLFESWRLNRNAYLVTNPCPGEHVMNSNLAELQNNKPELRYCMIRFICEVKKVNGEHYHSSTIWDIFMTIQMCLNRQNPDAPIKFMSDPQFLELKTVVDSTMKQHTGMGLGQRNQVDIITIEQEEILWQKCLLGDSNPEQLNNTILYLLGLNFALRGGQYYRAHSESNFVIKNDKNGRYLEYIEFRSKCKQGGISSRKIVQSSSKRRAYENKDNPDRCVVRIYEKLIQHLPTGCPAKALFYKPAKNFSTASCWYERNPRGKNTLDKVITDLCKQAGFQGI